MSCYPKLRTNVIKIVKFCHFSHIKYIPTQKKKNNKGKAIPLQACIGPESSRRLRLSNFKTIGT